MVLLQSSRQRTDILEIGISSERTSWVLRCPESRVGDKDLKETCACPCFKDKNYIALGKWGYSLKHTFSGILFSQSCPNNILVSSISWIALPTSDSYFIKDGIRLRKKNPMGKPKLQSLHDSAKGHSFYSTFIHIFPGLCLVQRVQWWAKHGSCLRSSWSKLKRSILRKILFGLIHILAYTWTNHCSNLAPHFFPWGEKDGVWIRKIGKDRQIWRLHVPHKWY